MAELPQAHLQGLKVAVTGASGNVGTALLRRLTAPGSGVAEVRGLARRQPPDVEPYSSVTWYTADLGETSSEQALTNLLEGVDAVVHLAWALQPGRRPEELRRANVDGTRRVMRSAVAAGVRHVVHMSSLGAYTGGGGARPVTEDWPVTGIPSSQYSRQKSEAERVVREVVGRRGDITLTTVRPTLVLQPEAASEIGRYFLGPLVLGAVRLVPGAVASVLPLPLPSLEVGFVHADDLADALTRMLDRRVPGPVQHRRRPRTGRRRHRPRPGHDARPGPRRAGADGAGGGVPRARGAHRAGLARPRHPVAGARHHPRPHPAGLAAGAPRRRRPPPVRRGPRARRRRSGSAAVPDRRPRARPAGDPANVPGRRPD
jgi:nucleoside-diphosphate-sugar epimerase